MVPEILGDSQVPAAMSAFEDLEVMGFRGRFRVFFGCFFLNIFPK